MKILETERLILREIVESDAEFILDLLNQPSFIKYIGDRNVRDLEQAREFIETRYRKSYAENGFGLICGRTKTQVFKFKLRVSNSEIRSGFAVLSSAKVCRMRTSVLRFCRSSKKKVSRLNPLPP